MYFIRKDFFLQLRNIEDIEKYVRHHEFSFVTGQIFFFFVYKQCWSSFWDTVKSPGSSLSLSIPNLLGRTRTVLSLQLVFPTIETTFLALDRKHHDTRKFLVRGEQALFATLSDRQWPLPSCQVVLFHAVDCLFPHRRVLKEVCWIHDGSLCRPPVAHYSLGDCPVNWRHVASLVPQLHVLNSKRPQRSARALPTCGMTWKLSPVIKPEQLRPHLIFF